MKVLFITRHEGAIHWAKAREAKLGITEYLSHLSEETIKSLKEGDVVIGILPIQIIARLNKAGILFYALTIDVPQELRGVELTQEQMALVNCKIQNFTVLYGEEIEGLE